MINYKLLKLALNRNFTSHILFFWFLCLHTFWKIFDGIFRGISTIDEIYVVDMNGILIVTKRKVMDRVGNSAHIKGH